MNHSVACFAIVALLFASDNADAQERQRQATQLKSQPIAVLRKTYPRDSQPHPDHAYRAEKVRTDNWSATRVTESAAGHAVIYARQRYGIGDLVSDVDYERASKEMADYLSWKHGSQSVVAEQWITAGYHHFDTYVAVAAAALIGMELPGPAETVTLTKELTMWLKVQADSMSKDAAYQPCAVAMVNLVGAGCEETIRLAAEAAKSASERITISSAAFNLKRSFNVSDSSAEFMIYLKRNPTHSLRPSLRPVQVIATGEASAQH